MRYSVSWFLVAAFVSLSLCSCGPDGRGRRQTYPVTGRVTVDGSPAAKVKIAAVDQKKDANDPNYPISPFAVTKEDGSFQMTSYEDSDGLPTGEYVLTFVWQETKGFKAGPDKLGGRYSDPAQSQFKCKVEGSAVDLGTCELTTK